MPFPAIASFTGPTVTEAQFKAALADLLLAVAQAGTGVSQLTNVVKIGWDGSHLRVTIDTTDLGKVAVFNASDSKLTLLAEGTAANHAITKAYADAIATAKLSLAGGTMTGALTVLAPTTGGHAVNRTYLESAIAGFQAALGFTPVRQGGGPGQGTDQINLGWKSSTSELLFAVAGVDKGALVLKSDIGLKAFARFNGFTAANLSGAYDRVSNVISIQINGHGMRVGDKIYLDFTTGSSGIPVDGLYDVASVVNANEFTIALAGTNTSGNVTMFLFPILKGVNVSSVTKDPRGGTTNYWLNFTSPMGDAEYGMEATSQAIPGSWAPVACENSNAGTSYNTTSGCSLFCAEPARRFTVSITA